MLDGSCGSWSYTTTDEEWQEWATDEEASAPFDESDLEGVYRCWGDTTTTSNIGSGTGTKVVAFDPGISPESLLTVDHEAHQMMTLGSFGPPRAVCGPGASS